MDYLVEGTNILSKNALQKSKAGQEPVCHLRCEAGCSEHCSIKIIVCWSICYVDHFNDNSSPVNR